MVTQKARKPSPVNPVEPVKAKRVSPAKGDKKRASAGREKTTGNRKIGRPSTYSVTIADAICARVASGEPLYRICAEENMPHLTTIYSWLRKYDEFAKNYARAKEDLADTMASRIQDIIDEKPDRSTIDGKVDSGWVQYQRLKVDTLKWQAGKLKPKVYGEKLDVNHGGQAENPVLALVKQISGTALPVVRDADSVSDD